MTSRILLPLLCLFLASCATTKNTGPEPAQEIPDATQADLPKGTGDSIDEHLLFQNLLKPQLM